MQDPLIYFTHVVDGRIYGAWYRRLSPTELEVFAIGLMRRASCPEGEELTTSRAILEEFVRRGSGATAGPPPDHSTKND